MNLQGGVLLVLSSFFSSSNGLEFVCNFLYYKNLFNFGPAYTCEFPKINILNSSTVLQYVRGNHLIGYSDVDVIALYLDYDDKAPKVYSFPTGIEKFFPNLSFLQWYCREIKTVTAEALRFPELKFLSFGENQIASLDGDLFKYTPLLNTIDFFANGVSSVGRGLLENLSQLKNANFENNACIRFLATTPQEIQELKVRISTQCSPLTTSTPITTTTMITPTEAHCDVRCTVNEEIDELVKKLAEQDRINKEQNEAIEILIAMKKKYNEAMKVLSALIAELSTA